MFFNQTKGKLHSKWDTTILKEFLSLFELQYNAKSMWKTAKYSMRNKMREAHIKMCQPDESDKSF